ncbi:MAG: hypothetical protein MZU97_26455 [Bacillus subtilis]|nr:hypothetical protein [Bacillus subtilis]
MTFLSLACFELVGIVHCSSITTISAAAERSIRTIPDYHVGIEIGIGIVTMLLTFLAAEKVKCLRPHLVVCRFVRFGGHQRRPYLSPSRSTPLRTRLDSRLRSKFRHRSRMFLIAAALLDRRGNDLHRQSHSPRPFGEREENDMAVMTARPFEQDLSQRRPSRL